MFKTFLTTLIATVITSLIAISIINPGLFYDLKNFLFFNINLSNIIDNVSTQDDVLRNDFQEDVSSLGSSTTIQDLFLYPMKQGQNKEDREEALLYTSGATKEAERLIQEALAHSDYEKRYILNGIIKEYNLQIEAIFNELELIEQEKYQENMLAVLATINRHIFIWDPYYYFVHPDSQTPIAVTSTDLKNKHKELMRSLVDKDAQEAGEVATNYIKFLIEDIAKSGRRNNSDFVLFSYANYQSYKRFFDELAETNNNFNKGFAQEFPTLFNSFYNMHRDVHPDHNQEVRGFLFAMREGLIAQHQGVLSEFAQEDKKQIEKTIEEIINILEEQKVLRAEQHEEVRAVIDADLMSYKNF